MGHGYFDQRKREYAIDRVDVPVSWTNCLGVEDLCAAVDHTAGGYLFYKSPEHHQITGFRSNGVPMDRLHLLPLEPLGLVCRGGAGQREPDHEFL